MAGLEAVRHLCGPGNRHRHGGNEAPASLLSGFFICFQDVLNQFDLDEPRNADE